MMRTYKYSEDAGHAMKDELKQCPFCGTPAKQITMGTPGVTCPKGCCYMFRDTRENVNAAWNTRPIEDELNARIAELESIVDKFAEAGTELYHRVKAEWAADAGARVDWKELMRTYKKDWVI